MSPPFWELRPHILHPGLGPYWGIGLLINKPFGRPLGLKPLNRPRAYFRIWARVKDMSEKEEKGRTLLVVRYKYGMRIYDPFNSHYSYYIKESDERPGWCEIFVEEDDKILDIIEHKCVIKNRDHDELTSLLQEVMEHIVRNYDKLILDYDKLKVASIVFADKHLDP